MDIFQSLDLLFVISCLAAFFYIAFFNFIILGIARVKLFRKYYTLAIYNIK